MSHTYDEINEILKISQDRAPARDDRFEAFRRAVSFYVANSNVQLPTRQTFLVAGTNGKGTVAKTLETLLSRLPNANVGLYTSPHLIEPTERIRSGERDLTPDEMVKAYSLIENTIVKFELTHFEILTLLMIEVFFGGQIRPRVTHAVIEVGVGGRLDPTRVVPHDTSVIAKIGIDHEAILGNTIEQIAREKLAIAEGAKRVIYMSTDANLKPIFKEAETRFTPARFNEARSFTSRVEHRGRTPRWVLETPWGDVPLALYGERAVQNTSLALEVLHHTGYDVAKLLPAVSTVVWPGRMERLSYKSREIYLSGDHNEQGVASLRDLLKEFRYEKLWLVVGVGKGKPIDAMLAIYREISRANLVLTRTTFRPIEMSEIEKHPAVAVYERAIDALDFAIASAAPNDLIVVSGSLYLVGDLRALIQRASMSGDEVKPIT